MHVNQKSPSTFYARKIVRKQSTQLGTKREHANILQASNKHYISGLCWRFSAKYNNNINNNNTNKKQKKNTSTKFLTSCFTPSTGSSSSSSSSSGSDGVVAVVVAALYKVEVSNPVKSVSTLSYSCRLLLLLYIHIIIISNFVQIH